MNVFEGNFCSYSVLNSFHSFHQKLHNIYQPIVSKSARNDQISIDEIEIWILRYSKALAAFFIKLPKEEKRKMLRSAMTQAERYLILSLLSPSSAATLLLDIESKDQQYLLKVMSLDKIVEIIQSSRVEETRRNLLSILEPDVREEVEKKIILSLAKEIKHRLRNGEPHLAIAALKRMPAEDGGSAMSILEPVESAEVLGTMLVVHPYKVFVLTASK